MLLGSSSEILSVLTTNILRYSMMQSQRTQIAIANITIQV
jgi:hypothetical protein